MRKLATLTGILATLVLAPRADAAISSVFGGAVSCAVQGNGVRFCAGTSAGVPTWDGTTPIDVNVALPPVPASGPDGNYPVIGIYHGWGGSKLGLSSMNGYALRGYAVFSMSDRGWGNSCGGADSKRAMPVCANGYNHLLDTRFEVHDAQYLLGVLADEGVIDPQRVGATGGSYGGGMSMALAALKDRVMMPNGSLVPWKSPSGTPMQIAAAVPEIPWSDLAYSLMPNGHTLDYVADAPYFERMRVGVLKQSFVAALYALGQALSNYAAPGTDPSADLTTWYGIVNAGEPYDQNPQATGIVTEITTHHSSYYIDHSEAPPPLLISNGGTDDLFPVDEAVRFYNRTRSQYPGADISLFFLDYGHMRGQGKSADTAVLHARQDAWFDYYLQGIGPKPFQGIEALTQTCPSTAASLGPFFGASWAELAPGEIRLSSAAAQTIVPGSGDPSRGQAYDPIAGSGACATASGSDQTGVASYRLAPPTGGFTLLGSATIVADINSPGPTSQIAARLLDVGTDGNATLVARGLYRPEINTGTETSCQVFQLHPNAYRFAAGHIAKLELLPADDPYGRVSNGQLTVTVSNLELRLPVAEQPDGVLINAPGGKVLPPGYTFASTVYTSDARCPVTTSTTTTTQVGATTTTSPAATTTTTSASTTTTTAATAPLHLTKARVHSGTNGSIRVSGDFPTPPVFSVPPPVSVRVQDSATLDQLHTFDGCTSSRAGVRCLDTVGGRFKASFKPTASGFKFKVSFQRIAIPGPLAAPLKMTLAHNDVIARMDTMPASACRQSASGLSCRKR